MTDIQDINTALLAVIVWLLIMIISYIIDIAVEFHWDFKEWYHDSDNDI